LTPIKHALEEFAASLAEQGIVTDEVTISLPFNALYKLWNELSPMPIPTGRQDALEIHVHTSAGMVRVRGLS
jgi:uncharacterized membrane protein